MNQYHQPQSFDLSMDPNNNNPSNFQQQQQQQHNSYPLMMRTMSNSNPALDKNNVHHVEYEMSVPIVQSFRHTPYHSLWNLNQRYYYIDRLWYIYIYIYWLLYDEAEMGWLCCSLMVEWVTNLNCCDLEFECNTICVCHTLCYDVQHLSAQCTRICCKAR